MTEEEEEAMEPEVAEEEEEECDLDSYLDSQDWSRWVGRGENKAVQEAAADQVVFGM